jgi:hypothetical protein
VGTVFDRVIFDNSGSTGTGFESDNHTVYSGTVTIPGSVVFIATLTDTQPPLPAAEPATMGCALIALSVLLRQSRRRRRPIR